ncbi:MAG: type 1 glutamine amidotransferase [Myxococcales bacterium]
MAHVIAVQHEPGEGLGALSPALAAAGLSVQLVRTWLSEPVPRAPGAASGVVVLGGGMSCVPPAGGALRPLAQQHLDDERALLGAACDSRLPVLGICLGSQLLALALGGGVARAPRRELGFLRVRLDAAAQGDPLFAGLAPSAVAFHWHEDAFSLPPGAVALASSTATPLQAFRAGSAWGIQFHPELTLAILSAMIETGAADLADAGADPAELLEAARRELPRMEAFRGPIFTRWAALAAGGR